MNKIWETRYFMNLCYSIIFFVYHKTSSSFPYGDAFSGDSMSLFSAGWPRSPEAYYLKLRESKHWSIAGKGKA